MKDFDIDQDAPLLASLRKQEPAVPEGYFEELPAILMANIEAMEAETPVLAAAPQSLPAVPDGYFDALPSEVMAKIAAETLAPSPRKRTVWTVLAQPTARWAMAAAVALLVVSGLALWRKPTPLPAVATPVASTDAILKTLSHEDIIAVLAEQHTTLAHVSAAVNEQQLNALTQEAHRTAVPVSEEDILDLLPATPINPSLDDISDEELEKLTL